MLSTLLLLAAPLAAPVQGKIAVRAGRILPVVGPEVTKGVVLVEDGRIAAIGRSSEEGTPPDLPLLEVPWDATVVDAPEGVLFPGMIEAHTTRGLDRPNENVPVTPFIHVLDGLDPASTYFEDALRDGITALFVVPGNDCVIGGRGRVVKPFGRTVEAMTILPEGGMKISVAPKQGFTRLSQLAELRKTFVDLAQERERLLEKKRDEKEAAREKEEKEGKPGSEGEKGEEKEKEVEVTDEDFDEKKRPLLDLVAGRMPAFVWCEKAMDVPRAIEVASENGFLSRTTLVLGPECWKAADAIAAAGRPVVLDPNLEYVEENPLTGEERRTFVPAVFQEKGIRFALQTTSTSLGPRYLWFQAARCVAFGLPREAALRAVTLAPAEILGLGARMGSIEVGKDATFLLLTGDPLDATTWVDRVFLGGEVVYERSKDKRLQELLEGEAPTEKEGGKK
jgi:imidazolonepropionase-like amidohydrolase